MTDADMRPAGGSGKRPRGDRDRPAPGTPIAGGRRGSGGLSGAAVPSEGGPQRSANLLGALSLAVTDAMRRATEDAAGHTSAGPAALVALDQFLDGRSLDDLRRALGLTGSGAVRLVDRLERDGHVRRRAGPDGRTLALVLTARGRRAAERVQATRAAALEAVLGGLDDWERAELARLHERLLEGVTQQRLAARQAGELENAAWLCRLCDFEACGRPHGDCPAARIARGSGTGET